MKKFLASVMVIALLATMSLTAFAAEPNTVYGFTQLGEMTREAITATSTDATNGQTTFTAPATKTFPTGEEDKVDTYFFTGWTNEGSAQLIGDGAKWTDETITVIGNVPGVVVTAHYTLVKETGTQKVAVFSWATGIMLPCGTAEYTTFNFGSPKITSAPSLVGKNFMLNDDGTVTFTRTEKSGNAFVGGENKFVGWALDGEFEVIDGDAKSDSLTVRIITGRDIIVKDEIADNIFGAYEMYDVSGTVKGIAEEAYKAGMLLHDHLIKLIDKLKDMDCELPVITTKPAETDKPADEDTDDTSPDTGSGSMAALAVVMILSSTAAIVTKKRYRA